MATKKKEPIPGRKTDPFRKAEAVRIRAVGKQQRGLKKQTPDPAKRGLGPSDSGEAQRVGGLKAAGKKYTGDMGASNARQTRSAVMTKKSSSGQKTSKR